MSAKVATRSSPRRKAGGAAAEAAAKCVADVGSAVSVVPTGAGAPSTAMTMASSSKRFNLDRMVSVVSLSSTERSESPIDLTVSSPDGVERPMATKTRTNATTKSDKTNGGGDGGGRQTSPRRSGRERKSTIVRIDGHDVKVANNYVLKGMSYSYDAFEVDDPSSSAKGARKRKPATAAGVAKKAKKKEPAHLASRREHNAKVKRRAAQKELERRKFMARHVDVLSPFLEEKVERPLRSLDAREAGRREGEDEDEAVYVQPDLIQAEMRDYQLLGLSWMVGMHRRGLPMILGDEMGLGKTLQTISLLCHLKENEGISGPSLVICPLSVLYSWCNELTKWAPALKFLRFHSSDPTERVEQRQILKHSPLKYDVIVTTYEMAKSPQLSSLWSCQHFNYVVLDEGHIIKESTTQIATAVRKLHYENALILTGTPLQNNLVELWSILNFLYPAYFTRSEYFANAFDIGKRCVNKDMLHKAHKMLHLFMLRRLKEEVERLLPKKIETKVHWYKGLLLRDIALLSGAAMNHVGAKQEGSSSSAATSVSATTYQRLNNLVMQLRKCCLHPFLFDGAETDIDGTSLEELVAASGKLTVLDKLLRSLYEKGHRVVIFSQFTRVLDILDDYCRMRKWKFCRFDGSTARAKRNYTINKFNAPGSGDFIFLMSTRSGGMGINLQTADTCVLFDSDWNPQPDIQAQARVHRIGQKKTVHVYRLVSGGTVEERMVERAEKKLFLDQMVNGGTAAASDETASGLSASDLLATLRFGSNAVFGDSSNGNNQLPTNSDIEVITDRNRTEETSVGHLKGGTVKTAKDFDAEEKMTATTKFAGVDFKAIRDAQNIQSKSASSSVRKIADGWVETKLKERRERKSRIMLVDGLGSGYGLSSVPVLASNNYDLAQGESSVFDRELKNKGHFEEVKTNRQRAGEDFTHQNFCQFCGEGDVLARCNGCPVSFHEECAAFQSNQGFVRCSHHKCTMCGKSNSAAGGILFPCQSCPNSFCEDCLPSKGVRHLGPCPRFEKLGYDSTRRFCYIHCTIGCEQVAASEFGWSAEEEKTKQPCPEEIDVSFAFGKKVE